MALVEDIIGMVLIILVLIIMITLIGTQLYREEAIYIHNKQDEYLIDYYATTINNILSIREPNTKIPFNVLLSHMMFTGSEQVTNNLKTINITNQTINILDAYLGSGNYYMELKPVFSKNEISFVFDGSDSLDDERKFLADNISNLVDEINSLFERNLTQTIVYVYVLSNENTVCDYFIATPAECKVISDEELYSDELEPVMSAPSFGYSSNEEWQEKINDPDRLGKRKLRYYEGDWIAGSVYAQKEYEKRISNMTLEGGVLHVIVPVSDELSTSSIPDLCFDPTLSDIDHHLCTLCKVDCPASRAARNLTAAKDYLQITGALVIPVQSTRCTFSYDPSWNKIKGTKWTEKNINSLINKKFKPEPKTYCSLNECPGCSEANDPENPNYVCFQQSCSQTVYDHMNELASATRGSVVLIDDVNLLIDEIKKGILQSYQDRTVRFGTDDPDKERYVYKRLVTLPNLGQAEVELGVYQQIV